VDPEARVDMQLQVGELTQTLEVTSQAPMLKTERSDVATTYDQKQVAEMPILNRRFTTLQLMTPGVSLWPVSLTAAQPENPQGSYRILVNGQSFAGVSHLLDGTDSHDAVLGWIVINPTLESVTEAKVTTADFDAEFGTSAAAVVSSQTKSGTNSLHGSARRKACKATWDAMRFGVLTSRNSICLSSRPSRSPNAFTCNSALNRSTSLTIRTWASRTAASITLV